MYKHTQRLGRDEAQIIFGSKTQTQGEFFRLYYIKNDNKNSPSRFSIVVSKKIEQSAVKRNFLKRRARYIIQKHKNILANGYNFILLAQPEVTKAKFQEIERDTTHLLKKTHIYV